LVFHGKRTNSVEEEEDHYYPSHSLPRSILRISKSVVEARFSFPGFLEIIACSFESGGVTLPSA